MSDVRKAEGEAQCQHNKKPKDKK